ncbi:MAG: NAD(P)-dependent oxidoreductase [Acidobacteria bacterium]|nr:MAG: NAD(P)-dependent oxidoreductase [Acidobacteriota bacterium]
MTKRRVALIGLGLMGTGMARRLLGAGFPLTVQNRNRERAAPLGAEGAHVAASPREAAARADVVLSMVADDAASRAVWLGDEGALAGAARGAVLVECGTLTVGWIEELAREAASRGCALLDAPVTGSKVHAASGELLFLVGGSADALETARPALAAMSRAIVHVGATGSGALLKLINNFLCGVQAASLAEAIALIERSGLDRTKSLDVLTSGAPGSPLVKTLAGRMTARDYTPNFLLRLAAKDMKYALGEGRRRGLSLSTVGPVLELYERAIAGGHGEEDFSALVEPLREAAAPPKGTGGTRAS